MSLEALVEAIRNPIHPSIIGPAIDALGDVAADTPSDQHSDSHACDARATGRHAGAIDAAASPVEVAPDRLAAEIARLDASSKRTLRRRYKKLCEKTRELYDLERTMLPRPSDSPADHLVEAYYHEEDEHYANTECGYCLLELFNDVLRESTCVCDACDGLRERLLHYSGTCGCGICALSRTHEALDARVESAGRYVVPVVDRDAAMCGNQCAK